MGKKRSQREIPILDFEINVWLHSFAWVEYIIHTQEGPMSIMHSGDGGDTVKQLVEGLV